MSLYCLSELHMNSSPIRWLILGLISSSRQRIHTIKCNLACPKIYSYKHEELRNILSFSFFHETDGSMFEYKDESPFYLAECSTMNHGNAYLYNTYPQFPVHSIFLRYLLSFLFWYPWRCSWSGKMNVNKILYTICSHNACMLIICRLLLKIIDTVLHKE